MQALQRAAQTVKIQSMKVFVVSGCLLIKHVDWNNTFNSFSSDQLLAQHVS